jgi:hypothetical protein
MDALNLLGGNGRSDRSEDVQVLEQTPSSKNTYSDGGNKSATISTTLGAEGRDSPIARASVMKPLVPESLYK